MAANQEFGHKRQSQKSMISCDACGFRHDEERCPAWGKVCAACGKLNHFAKKCRSKPRQGYGNQNRRNRPKVYQLEEVNESSDEEFIFTVHKKDVNSIKHVGQPNKIHTIIDINGVLVECQLDSGSTVNVLPKSKYLQVFDDPQLEKLSETDMTLVMFNQSEMTPVGVRRVQVRNPKNRKKYSVEFVVVDQTVKPILGARVIQAMNLITVNKHNLYPKAEAPKEEVLQASTTDNTMFEGLGKLAGKLHLEVDPTVPPTKIPVRRIPVSLKDRVQDELMRLTNLGVITPVTTPTDWISSIVVVKKHNGNLRLCIDPKPLNKALKRNNYAMPTIEDILPELNKARLFSVVDAKDGFWHIELDEESSYLTTFGTPWGRYRWIRMPFGISPAPEEFQRRLDEALEGLEGTKAIHDDIVVFGCGDTDAEARQDHDRKLHALFDRCREKNIKLNKEKLKLCLSSVTYLGHVISERGLEMDPAKVKAITEMPTPKDKAGIQRLLGMINFVQKFAPRLSELTSPLRDLLKKDSEFIWDEAVHGQAFSEIKATLSDTPVLRYFDPKKQTILQCDASEYGLGACLLQEGHPVGYASRALTATECNYAQIEKELLAVVFGMTKFEQYTYGNKVIVESDHKPLEIIHKKNLFSTPKRLQRMLLNLQRFDYTIIYKKGTHMYMADTLSRAFLPSTDEERRNISHNIEVEQVNGVKHLAVSPETLCRLQRATKTDTNLAELMCVIRRGWPDSMEQLSLEVKKYFPFREELTIQNGLVFKNDRVIVPFSERQNMIERAHSSHIGLQGCLRRAKESLYWPNLYSDFEKHIQACKTCNTYSAENSREPMIPHETPNRPWEKVGVDLFHTAGKDYLLTVDYYSDFVEIDRLHDKKGNEVIRKLKSHFSRYGLPCIVMSDNGPPFNGKQFSDFSKEYEFQHITSSPRYPQSNGKVENAVRTVKRILEKSRKDRRDPYLAILDWRNTPGEIVKSSPVQRLYGRRTRTLLPLTTPLLEPSTIPTSETRKDINQRKGKEQHYYNRGTKALAELMPGETVRMKPTEPGKEWTKARVKGKVNIRSYKVQTEEGSTYRRNRRHLHKTPEVFTEDDGQLNATPEGDVPDTPNVNEDQAPPTTDHEEPHAEVTLRRSNREVNRPNYLNDYVCILNRDRKQQ
ncbi:uncharacterized protein K02A2.6-like [Pecten maximus]|uniref:uncharacterized protein K02A2.6-like n=1 Tax=Pecten maximus TaxID=6579 RepID=UPI001458CFB5|nr:uncharacterized protein K02A2.6-like [Pecten maximus]